MGGALHLSDAFGRQNTCGSVLQRADSDFSSSCLLAGMHAVARCAAFVVCSSFALSDFGCEAAKKRKESIMAQQFQPDHDIAFSAEAVAAASAFAAALFDDVREISRDGEGVTREAFGPVETKTIERIAQAGRELGLSQHTDEAGNLWLQKQGAAPELPMVVLGSHADSVPEGGNFDGLAGIAAGLTALFMLKQAGVTLSRTIAVLALRGEENSFYGKPYLGSRAILGELGANDLALVRRDGAKTLESAMRACGLNPERLAAGRPLIDFSTIRAFIELHIEQGPMLDMEAHNRTGIVTGIRGLYSHKAIRCERADPNAPADAVPRATAALLVRMEKRWQAALDADDDLVETTGVIGPVAEPKAACIDSDDPFAPVEALQFAFDIRSLRQATCLAFHAVLEEEAAAVGRERGVRFVFDPMLESHPAKMDDELRRVLHQGAAVAGVPVRDIASGAGHDSAYFANAGIPTTMIFVANQLGSHNPHEAMRMEDFMAGVRVLAAALPILDA